MSCSYNRSQGLDESWRLVNISMQGTGIVFYSSESFLFNKRQRNFDFSPMLFANVLIDIMDFN